MTRLLSLTALAALLAALPAAADPIRIDYGEDIQFSGHVGGAPPGGTGYVRAPFYDGLDGRATLGVPLGLNSVGIERLGPAPETTVHIDLEVTCGVGR
ncbi:MAG: hypothetical protein ACRC33_22145 [Gemmataceae bacterium]